MFRRHDFVVEVNGTHFSEIWIDPHYEEKHGELMTDELILRLVTLLDQRDYEPEQVSNGFEWFVTDFDLDDKPYRIVWLLPPDKKYLGVRTAFRRSK